MSLRVGVDIGGTFTDVFAYDEVTGDIITAKAPSTPPTFVNGVFDTLKKTGISLLDVRKYIGHGSTIVDNMLVERMLPKVALITTKGFRDILETGRWWRGELYDLQWDKPAQNRPLVERKDIFVIDERMDSNGGVLRPLNEREAREVAQKIKKEEHESVAVFFINSYANPEHERRMGKILREESPDTYVTVSTDLVPIIRELPRLSTAVINACILPIVDKYIGELVRRLRQGGFKGELLIMQSNGGVMRSDITIKKPVYIATSGPAAGVVAAAHIAKLIGVEDIISFDMGGTTVKACIMVKGEYPITTEYQFEWDIPIAVPMIELVEMGAGGGSIAWIDKGGMLRVGPHSAGAVPGPVCYLRGGAEPTVTDANLVLGRLDPAAFLGGDMKIDREAAKLSIQEKIASPLELETEEAAMGIIGIVNTNMVSACRAVTMKKGYDPRDFVLVAFGGAGPMHCAYIARELEIPKVIIPLNPGVLSAYGMCTTDFFHDFVATYLVSMDAVDLSKLNTIYQRLEKEALSELRIEGIPEDKIKIQRFAKMKYEGEPVGWGLDVPVPLGMLTKASLGEVGRRFNKTHERLYSFYVPGEPICFVDLRLRGVGMVEKAKFKKWPGKGPNASEALKSRRKVYFEGSFIEVPIYDRYRLEPGNIISGPAIVEETQSTTVVLPDFNLSVDQFKNMILTLRGK